MGKERGKRVKGGKRRGQKEEREIEWMIGTGAVGKYNGKGR